MKLKLSRQIFEKLKYQISWKSVQWQPNCSMRTDGRTVMTKLMVAFRNIANAPNNEAPIPLPYAAIYGTNLHWSITMTTGSCNKCDNRRSRSCCGTMHTDGAQTKHAVYSAEEVCLLEKTTIYVNDKQSKTRLTFYFAVPIKKSV